MILHGLNSAWEKISEWIEEKPILNDVMSDQIVYTIVANRLCILPHEEIRTPIRWQFERIDQIFDEQQSTDEK